MRKGDWQIIQMESGERPFQVFQMEAKQALHYRWSLANEDEVQAFIQREHLVLLETTSLGVWPTRNYRRSGHTPSRT